MKHAMELWGISDRDLALELGIDTFDHMGDEASASRTDSVIQPGAATSVIYSLGGKPCLRSMNWGFVPYWTNPEDAVRPFAFAPVGEAHRQIPFRESFARRRCIVPARELALAHAIEAKRDPSLFQFEGRGERPRFFAGIWDHWVQASGTRALTFAVVAHRRGPGVWDALEIPTHEAMRTWLAHGSNPFDLKQKLEIWNPWLNAALPVPDRLRKAG